ncbi:MAG: transporter related [Paenibacillaceae bacterium]|nr:transporter related [Paenibacillaceae bacterium]
MPKKKMKPWHTVWSNIGYLLRDIALEYKLLLVFMIMECVCGVAIPFLAIFVPKEAVALVTEKAGMEEIWLRLGLLAAMLTVLAAVKGLAGSAKYVYSNDVRVLYQARLLMRSLTCDFDQVDGASGLNRYRKANRTLERGDWSGTSVLMAAMMDIGVSGASFILLSGLIALLHPLMVVYLILLSAVNYLALNHARRYQESRKDELAGIERKLYYVEHHSADAKAAKDVRIYTMANWFLLLREDLMEVYARVLGQIKERHLRTGAVQALTMLLRDGAAYAYLIWLVSADALSAADFVLYLGAVTAFSGWVQMLVENVSRIQGASLQLNDMRDFLEAPDRQEPEQPHALPAPGTPVGIEFRRVSFSYGGPAGQVLSNFSLHIAPGEKLAVVGLNGAGKSTLVKLLCGFSKPDSGDILINGLNINGFRKQDLYMLFSAVFQDIMIFPFTIAENISMTSAQKTDRARVWSCLELAGLAEDIRRIPGGIDANMLKAMDEHGVELSGGQQQKLLMARALYKDAPVLVLDEPTAALDPIAESETYDRFHRLCGEKTAIYISHRLASTRFCHRIVLIQGGAVAEAGSHAELLEQGGEYARMFRIQSHYYRKQEVPA